MDYPPKAPAGQEDCRRLTAEQVREQYIWSARYIDSPVVRDRDIDYSASMGNLGKAGSGLEQRVYYLVDDNLNVTGLTDTSGIVAGGVRDMTACSLNVSPRTEEDSSEAK